MTPPDEFRDNVITALKYLDQKLPPGSHVILTGLANGSVLYDSLSDIIYPLGRTRMDVKYKDFYTWLSCLQVSRYLKEHPFEDFLKQTPFGLDQPLSTAG